MKRNILVTFLFFLAFLPRIVAQNYNMGNSNVTTCVGNFRDSGGNGIFGDYGDNENLTMTFCSNTAGTCIRMVFTAFSLENNFDFLSVYNGPNAASPLLGTFTGTASPGTVTGTTGCLTFVFTSDIAVTSTGWNATISCLPCAGGGPCGSTCNGGPPPANDACSAAQNLGALPIPAACPNGIGAWANFNTTNLCATAENPYTALSGCQPSGNMASPSADVWYRFTITGPTLNVSISGLQTPNVGLYSGTLCNNLIPRGCAIGGGGILNTSFGGLAPGTYYLQVSGGSLTDQCTFTLGLQNNYDCAGCVIASGLTVNPPPVNGTYLAGQTVTFCYTISDYNQTSINWLHAVTPVFGPGWDMSTLTTVPPPSCDGQGFWQWYNQTFTSSATGLVTGPGFFYESPLGDGNGGYPDGNPGDNYGDNNPGNTCDWTFCWTISTLPPAQCIPDASLNITIDTYGDGESGSWTSLACTGDAVTEFFATLACCALPAVNITDVTCFGLTNGAATGSGQGTSPWDYVWQNGVGATIFTETNLNGSSTLSNLAAGTYTLIVTDNAGCTASSTFTVNQPAQILLNPVSTNVSCFGGANGSISLNPTGGTPNYNYQWSPAFGNFSTINGLTAGNYTVTITDLNGCTASGTFNIIQSSPVFFNTTTVAANCTGNTGSITINANGGTIPYQYSINGGATFQAGNVFNSLASGSYNVVVIDANGCQSTGVVNISAASAPVINSTPFVNVNCNGGNTGSITINASGGTGALQYSINGGATFQAGNVFNGLPAGVYNIVVTDAGNCQTTAIVNIIQPNPIVVVPNSTTAICGNNNGTITVTANGGTGALQYSINGGASFQAGNIFNGLAPGNYNIVVQDANGCQATGNIAVASAPGPNITSAPATNVNCNGGTNGSITINSNGGTGAIQYSIDNGATFQAGNVFNNLPAGTYNIIIQDANGCTAASTVNVTQPNPIVVNSNTVNATCGSSNGSITVNANGGIGALQYSNDGGATFQAGNIFNGLPAGNYNIVVQDANGCQGTAVVSVNNASAPVVNSVPVTDVNCNGGTTGSITVNGSGGTGALQFSIDNGTTFQAGNAFNNLPAGTYNIVIQDANGCQATTSVSITEPNPIVINPNSSNSTCGNNNGTITINANGGTGALQYSIDGGATYQAGNTFNTLAGGNYNIVVQDANGCTSSSAIVVGSEPSPTITSTPSTNVSCNGGANASITINSNGGTGAILYSIDNGTTFQAGNLFNNLPAGTYNIVVQDANGCTVTSTINISEPAQIVLNTNSVNATCGNSNGSVTINANGGTGVLQYSVDGGITFQPGNIFNGLAAGNYNVVVQDANGCTATGSIAVADAPGPVLTATPFSNVNCFGGSDGSISINANGGTGALQYSIDNGATYQAGNNFNGLPAGSYNIVVQDVNGCTVSTTVNITEPTQIAFSTIPVGTTCGNSNGSITINANGGTGVFQYSINGGANFQASNIFNGIAAGNYNIIVEDANGCQATAVLNVTDAASPVIASAPVVDVGCNGGNNGSITINGNGGTGVLQYSIDNGTTYQTSNIFNGLPAGNYNIIVQDANGCTATSIVNVAEPLAIAVNINTTDETCGNANGSITINANGGTGTLQYSIDNAVTFQGGNIFNNLPGGNYNIIVQDANGCTSATIASVIGAPAVTIASAPVTDVLCNGGNTGTLTINANGGTGAIQFSIDNGATFQAGNVFNGLTAGNYSVMIQDANGCTATLNVSVNEPTAVAFNSNIMDATCGNSNGSITINGNGGTGALQYSIDGGATFQSGNIFNALAAGNYNIVVQDANGCQSANAVVVNDLASPTIASAPVTDVSCNGGNNGTIIINSNGGTGAIQYSIDNGATFQAGNIFNNLPAGNYQIVIQDANGCQAVTAATISEPVALVLNSNSTTATCSNSNGTVTINANGGTGAIQYSIDNGATFQGGNIFNNLASGNYNIVIQDANGCTAAGNINVANEPSPVISSTPVTDVTCNAGLDGSITINANGGTGAIQYSIDNGVTYQPGNLFNNLAAGNYSVVIQDANGCTATVSINISEPAAINFNANTTTSTCGSSNGSITINGNGGTGALQFSIDGGVTFQSGGVFNALAAGNYNIVVQDASGCQVTGVASVSNALAPAISSAPFIDVTCNGGSNGSITVNANGGTGALQYSIDNGVTFQPGNIFNNLPAGTYNIVVQDVNGCVATLGVIIIEPTAVVFNSNTTTSTCGNSNGTITINGNGGTGVLQFSIDNGATFQGGNIFSNLASGNYNLVVQDANGCTANGTAIVNSEPPPTISATPSVNVSCNGGTNGSLTINSNGGTGTIQYSIDNGVTYQSGNSFNNLSAGNYSIVIQDANGCTTSTNVNITQPAAINFVIVTTDASCGNSDGTLTINANGGTGAFQFSIDGGITFQSGNLFNNLLAGGYNIVVQDANGCTAANVAAVNNASAPSITSAPSIDVSCFGGSNGSITVNGTGGTGVLQFSIDNGVTFQLGNVFNNLPAGTYNIIVEDANGCQASSSVIITEPAAVAFVANPVTATCGDNNGSISINGNGGTGALQYSIDNGTTFQSSGTFNNLASGNYNIIVQDANGCTAAGATVVNNEPSPTIASVNSTNLTCNGSNDGTITITANGGTGAIQFSIDNGATYQPGNSYSNLPAGNYSVIIQDINGCTATSIVNITQPPLIALNSATVQSTCGNSNGGITINANGGNGTYQFSIDSGATFQAGNIFNGLPAGNYNVIVQDGAGCTATAVVMVTNAAAPAISSIPVVNATCYGLLNGSITINANGGIGVLQYSIDNGVTYQSGNIFSNLPAGTYSIVVQDANGCTITLSANITEPPQITFSSSSVSSSCANSDGSLTITANGGTGVLQFSIDGGATFQAGNIFNNLGAGNYNIVIQDATGCQASGIGSISNINGPVISGTLTTDLTCFGSNNGTITITANGGIGALTYSIDNGTTYQAGNAFINLPGGAYSIVVIDGNNCIASSNVVINEPAQVVFNTIITDETCSNSNGTINVFGNGGTGTLQYSNNNGTTFQAGTLFNNLASGNYTIVVQDANGCTALAVSFVDNLASPAIVSTTATDVSCYNGNNGTIIINANGGTGVIQYSIDNGTTFFSANTFNNLPAGTYNIVIQDANGCTATSSANIIQPAAVAINSNVTIATCGNNNGTISINANGGTGTLQYSIDNGITFQSASGFTNLAPGNYLIVVQDANGCTVANSAIINSAPSPVIISVNAVNISCYGYNNGMIAINATGGSGTLQYSINGGTNYQPSNSFSNLTIGNYNIIVQDTNGCTVTSTANIIQPSAINLNTNATDVNCFGGNDGTAAVAVSGGTSPYSYSWSAGGSSSTINGLFAGSYTVTVTDANNCTTSISVIIGQPAALAITPSFTDVLCNGGNDGTATVVVTGGSTPYSYSWSSGATTSSANGLNAGNYSVIITDAHLCTITQSFVISQPPVLTATTLSTAVDCNGGNNGSITILPAGGTAPYSYQWSPVGGTSSTANNLISGNYSCIITDANGCTLTMTDSVSSPASLVVSTATTGVTCNGYNNGTVTAAVTGGTAPYDYLWSNGATTVSISNLAGGVYKVTVTDDNNCVSQKTSTVAEPQPLVLAVSGAATICISQSATISATVTGGTAPYTYNWNNGATTNSQNVTPVTTTIYLVSITDANGCTAAQQAVTVTVNPPLSVTASVDNAICEGQSTTISAIASGGSGGPYTYVWNNAAGNSSSATISPVQTTIYTIIVNDNCGTPVAMDSVMIIVHPLPEVTYIPEPPTGCVPLEVSFTDNSVTPAGSQYQWNFGDNSSGSLTNPVHIYYEPGTYSVSLTITTPFGCTSSLTIPNAVKVYSLPVASFTPDPQKASILHPQIEFKDESIDATIWSWDFGDAFGTSVKQHPVYMYRDTGLYRVTLIVENQHGCLDTTYGEVVIEGDFTIWIPNAFTPNNDGLNDLFNVHGTGIIQMDLFIFNRWGDAVFTTSDPKKGWNGRNLKANTDCPQDVYVYLVKAMDLKGEKHELTGRVTLIR